jgi:hypothetical protein
VRIEQRLVAELHPRRAAPLAGDRIRERAHEGHLSLVVVREDAEPEVTDTERGDRARSTHRVRRRAAPGGHAGVALGGVVHVLGDAVAPAELLHPLAVDADLGLSAEELEGVGAPEPEAIAEPRPIAAARRHGGLAIQPLRRQHHDLGGRAEPALVGATSREDVHHGEHRARAVDHGAGA